MKRTHDLLASTLPVADHHLRAAIQPRLRVTALLAATVFFCVTAFAQTLEPQQIRTYSRLLELLKEHKPTFGMQSRQWGLVGNTSLPALLTTTAADAPATAAGVPYSQTLVQVAGVDEMDQVKNDDACIYQVNGGGVLIIRASPEAGLEVISFLDFTGQNFSPQGLYLDAQFLVVVGAGSHEPIPRPIWRKWSRLFGFPQNSTVQAKVYDITDRQHPRMVREIEIDGDYVGTRKIGSTLYLVSRYYPHSYDMQFKTWAAQLLATPGFRDTRCAKGFKRLSPVSCYYLPGFEDPNFLVIAGINLEDRSSHVKINAYLGAGEKVYASLENLYITSSHPVNQLWLPIFRPIAFLPSTISGSSGMVAASAVTSMPDTEPTTEHTEIYKISLADGKPAFHAAARVPGTILNSYSMDEYDGYLRVATTTHAGLGAERETNRVYVLDTDLKPAGKLEDIAPGERIYSARFLGSRLFLVTFRKVDPLFAIDLSDPANPFVAGELTLPGYSDFLLPYDEDHLIGLGKDADPQTGYYQGMKLALFDVSDMRNPSLVSSVSIGDRGTDSPALQDPHALLFDPARNLLAFPLRVAEVPDPDPAQPWQWGNVTFQGAYVFSVCPEGFEFRGSITHLRDENSGGDPCLTWDQRIDRVLTIGSDLFTLSPGEVRAHDIETLAPKAALHLR